MNSPSFTTGRVETARHRTTWIEAGPANGPLLVFAHGWAGRKFRIADAHTLLRFVVEWGRHGRNGRSVTTFSTAR